MREYIEGHLSGDLSLNRLAATAGLSPSHFTTQFRQATGFTPHQYVLQRRLERAQTMLLTTDRELVEIAAACGFANQSRLTTRFRRFTGQPPGRFRVAGRLL